MVDVSLNFQAATAIRSEKSKKATVKVALAFLSETHQHTHFLRNYLCLAYLCPESIYRQLLACQSFSANS